MVICFGGMVTITLSGAKRASNEASEISVESGDGYTSESLILGYSLIFLCSWIYASNCVLNRALKHVHHAIVMFWHGICGISLAIIAVLIE